MSFTITLEEDQVRRLTKACGIAAASFNDGISALLGIGSAEADAYAEVARALLAQTGELKRRAPPTT